MLSKHSYFTLMCDHRYPNGRCKETLGDLFTPGVSEGASSEWAIREARAQGWKVVSRGAWKGHDTYCPDHKPPKKEGREK
jgi:hypothetical protein